MSNTSYSGDPHSSRESDEPASSDGNAPGTPGTGPGEEESSLPSYSHAGRSDASGAVPPEKAPPKRPAKEETTASASDSSPAAKLKGLQQDKGEERRGLLARSRRLQSMLTSNRPLGVRNLLWATLLVLLVIAGLLAATGRIDAVTQSIVDSFRPQPQDPQPERPLEEVASKNDGVFSFAEMANHPDNALQPYFTGSVAGTGGAQQGRADLIQQFRRMVTRFEHRMGTDDNFSLRVSDSRTDSVLEVYTLEEERKAYLEAGKPHGYNWGRINHLRRQEIGRLVDKYVAKGIPEEPIRIKYGLANQVEEAHRRDLPFLEYEVRLADFLGMSLLATEIGTVETFNQDRLVSPVNAKSRYQLMPALLRQYDIHRYRLETSAGNSILVAEEQHPLFVMEPAFKHMASGVNAVGHEVPGISAYHTGIGNIYTVLRKFLNNARGYLTSGVTTMDAYMWAITEGFETVSRGTSFGDFSREYVVSAYGALKAVEEAPIDTSKTMLADRVQLADGQSISLNELLTTLADGAGGSLDWSTPDSLSLYARFRSLNRHFHLPAAGPGPSGDSLTVGVPERGNVHITATSQGEPVRFFLPPGARRVLRSNGYPDLIDEDRVFQFDHNTYTKPDALTRWDRQYTRLIEQARQFGFTRERRNVLGNLVDQFEQLAEQNPSSHYRKTMYEVIDKHHRFWRYGAWEELAEATQEALGPNPAQPQPPEYLPTQPLETPENIGAE